MPAQPRRQHLCSPQNPINHGINQGSLNATYFLRGFGFQGIFGTETKNAKTHCWKSLNPPFKFKPPHDSPPKNGFKNDMMRTWKAHHFPWGWEKTVPTFPSPQIKNWHRCPNSKSASYPRPIFLDFFLWKKIGMLSG